MYEVIRLINHFSKVPYELFLEYSSDFHGVEDIPPKLTSRFLVAPSESSDWRKKINCGDYPPERRFAIQTLPEFLTGRSFGRLFGGASHFFHFPGSD